MPKLRPLFLHFFILKAQRPLQVDMSAQLGLRFPLRGESRTLASDALLLVDILKFWLTATAMLYRSTHVVTTAGGLQNSVVVVWRFFAAFGVNINITHGGGAKFVPARPRIPVIQVLPHHVKNYFQLRKIRGAVTIPTVYMGRSCDLTLGNMAAGKSLRPLCWNRKWSFASLHLGPFEERLFWG